MSRPKDLPGFYYDEVKNRYFPIKGPIPGSSSSSASHKASSKAPKTPAAVIKRQCRASTTSSLLRARELGGNVFPLRKRKCRFENEYLNAQVLQPQVWRYDETFNVADTALDDFTVDIITPQGQARTAALLTGSTNGRLSFFAVGTGGDYFDYECMSRQIWPCKKESEKCSTSTPPVHLWRPLESSIQLSSDISCIRSLNKRHSEITSSANRALITTLGSDRYGGIVYVINLGEPLDFHLRIGFGHINEVASFNSTIWTSDCSSTKNQAVMGTSSGAALVNLENGATSWVCRTESDVFAQQFDQSGNVVLCGLRNGAILTVDIREDQRGSSSTSPRPRLPRHRIPYSPSNKNAASSSKKWFTMSGKIHPSSTTFMPNSVASLISLQLYDQYFLASSMDGSIKLYDHRLVSRGPVQSYEGHVNTHTRLQLGVDPYERFVVAGGEDRSMRLWSIKSGKLLFEDKLFSANPVSVCCQIAGGFPLPPLDGTRSSNLDNSWGSWHGSREGLFYTSWC